MKKQRKQGKLIILETKKWKLDRYGNIYYKSVWFALKQEKYAHFIGNVPFRPKSDEHGYMFISCDIKAKVAVRKKLVRKQIGENCLT